VVIRTARMIPMPSTWILDEDDALAN